MEELLRQEMQQIEASMLGKLVDVVQECQNRLFRLYLEKQQSKKPSSTNFSSQDGTASDFLNAAFQQPPPIPGQGFDVEIMGTGGFEDGRFEDPLFSDSGYGQDMSCYCIGACRCPLSLFATQEGLRGQNAASRRPGNWIPDPGWE